MTLLIGFEEQVEGSQDSGYTTSGDHEFSIFNLNLSSVCRHVCRYVLY